MVNDFSKESIEKKLNNSSVHINFFENIDSTMLESKRIIYNCLDFHNTVVVATEQTSGKGRLGRSFYSPKHGGLYFSLILSNEIIENPAVITANVATAVCRGIKSVYNKSCQIKWVNDLLLNNKKVCGILTEGIINPETNKIDTVIIGIGINIFVDENEVPCELKDIIGGIVDSKSDIKKTELLCSVLENIFFIFKNQENRSAALLEYKSNSALIGKKIKVYPVINQMDNYYFCTVEDVSDDAKLIVRTETNEVKYLDSGEVSIFSQNITE